MKFTIVTPLYNKEEYIADTIDSVLAQTYTDFEFIIVNDCSTDKSADVVKSYDDRRIQLYTKPNGGVSAARNFGIEKAKGDIICFLDADDLWEPQYLEELASMEEKYPDAGFFCTAFHCFIEDKNNIVGENNLNGYTSERTLIIDFFEISLKTKRCIALTSAVSIKKKQLLSLEKWFDEDKSMGEDNDLWVRVALKTKVAYNNRPLMLYRQFATGGITASKPNIKNSVDYSSYYGYSDKIALHKFATLMLYTLALRCYMQHQYDDTLKCLKRIKGNYLLSRRLYLLMRVFIKCLRVNEK